jgi:hypothetical protein
LSKSDRGITALRIAGHDLSDAATVLSVVLGL